MAGPDISFETGSCRAAIFYNEIQKNGETLNIPNIVITRSYLDKNNEWKTTSTFRLNDLPKLIIVVSKAYDYLTSKKKGKQEPNGN